MTNFIPPYKDSNFAQTKEYGEMCDTCLYNLLTIAFVVMVGHEFLNYELFSYQGPGNNHISIYLKGMSNNLVVDFIMTYLLYYFIKGCIAVYNGYKENQYDSVYDAIQVMLLSFVEFLYPVLLDYSLQKIDRKRWIDSIQPKRFVKVTFRNGNYE